MIIRWETEAGTTPSLSAHPDEYDAIPSLRALLMDALPAERHPDREALAAYLSFGRWISGDLVLPKSLSPLTAEAIEVDARPVRARPREVAYTPQRLPRGRLKVMVRFGLPAELPVEPTLAIVPNVVAQGVFRTGQLLVVPSNAFALDRARAEPAESVRARLAVAVLFAADIDADILKVDGEGLPSDEARRLVSLLRCVNLELDIV